MSCDGEAADDSGARAIAVKGALCVTDGRFSTAAATNDELLAERASDEVDDEEDLAAIGANALFNLLMIPPGFPSRKRSMLFFSSATITGFTSKPSDPAAT